LFYKDIIEFGDRKFLLYRTIRETEKTTQEAINLVKKYWHCDTVLKKENNYYFCNEIQTIDYEEIRNDSTTPN
jgi:hypothetical protein|tara:strand:+ start:337 stop:555 length:219 start_codon:yes stop_codon:yes gene_type:complete